MSTMDMDVTDNREYRGVLAGRMVAFIIDYVILLVLMVPIFFLYILFGLVTLGLGFYLAPVPFVVVAALYFGLTMGSDRQATPGMRMMGLVMTRDDGQPIDFLIAIVHFVLFWVANALLTPLVLLVGLFTNRSRLLHDIALGTAMARRSY